MDYTTKIKLLSTQQESAMIRSVTKRGGSASPDVITDEGATYYDAYTGQTLKGDTLGNLARKLLENEENHDALFSKITEIRRQMDEKAYAGIKASGKTDAKFKPALFAAAYNKLTPQEKDLWKESQVMIWGIKRIYQHAVKIGSRGSIYTKATDKNPISPVEQIKEKLIELGADPEINKNVVETEGNRNVLIATLGKQNDDTILNNDKAWDALAVFFAKDSTPEQIAETRKVLHKNFGHRKLMTEDGHLQIGDVSFFSSGVHYDQLNIGTGDVNLPHEHYYLFTRAINNKNYVDYKDATTEDIKNNKLKVSALYPNVRRVTAIDSLNDIKFHTQLMDIINAELKEKNLPLVQFVKREEKLNIDGDVVKDTAPLPPINSEQASEFANDINSPLNNTELTEEERAALDAKAKAKIEESKVKGIEDISVEDADPILIKAHAILKEKSERLAKEMLDTKETADAIHQGIVASVNLKKANMQIENLTNVVAEKEISLAEASKTIEVKNEVIEEKEQEVKAFAAKNSELFDKLTVSDTELAQRDFETKQVAKVFKNPKLISEIKDNNLVTNDDMFAILTGIESKQAGIVRLRKKINEIHKEKRVEIKALNEQVSTLESKVTALNRVIKAKDMIVAKKDSVIESLNSTIYGLKDHITNLVEAHTKKLADVKASMKQGYRGFINKLKDNFNNTVIPAKEAQAKADAVEQYENNVLPGKIATVQKKAMQAAIKEYEENNLPEKVAEAIIAYKGTEEYKKEFEQEVKTSVSLKTAELSKKISELEKSQNVNVETLALYVLELRDQIESLKQSPVENEGVDKILDDLQKSLDNDNDNNSKPKV